jgi:hypothetical protein
MTVAGCQGFCMTGALRFDSLFGIMLVRCVNELLSDPSPFLLSLKDQLSEPAT